MSDFSASTRSAPIRWTAPIRRRTISLVCVFVAAAIVAAFSWYQRQTLAHDSVLTGWMLVASLVILAGLAVRRRLVSLPLVPVGIWVQVHVYLGLFFIVVYWMHVPGLIGSGGLERTVSLLVLAVTGLGLYGWLLSRRAPRRLAAIGQEVRYDQISWTRARLLDRADHLIQSLAPSEDREVLAKYYQDSIRPYLASSPTWFYLAFPTGSRRRKLLSGATELHRYLAPSMRSTAGELAALVRNRDDLDYHHAIQLRLRSWRSLHALLTIALLFGVVLHVFLALRMLGA